MNNEHMGVRRSIPRTSGGGSVTLGFFFCLNAYSPHKWGVALDLCYYPMFNK